MIYTYIIETETKEYYCGKTNNMTKRMKEHLKEKYPKWFSYPNRKKFRYIIYFEGDFEKHLKSFGIKKFYNMITKNKIYDTNPLRGLVS